MVDRIRTFILTLIVSLYVGFDGVKDCLLSFFIVDWRRLIVVEESDCAEVRKFLRRGSCVVGM